MPAAKGGGRNQQHPQKEELLVFARHYPIHFSLRWRALTHKESKKRAA
jgi:hypothetical protein